MTLYEHVPHPHLKHRAERGPVKVADTRPGGNPVTRFNTRAAVIVTRAVGTMWCAYAFACSRSTDCLPAFTAGAGFVQWASSQFIQLVLLPIIIVGSAVLAEASDRLAKRQFDDVEAILHAQDQAAAHLAAQDEKILAILAQVTALAAPPRLKARRSGPVTASAQGIDVSAPTRTGSPPRH